MSNLIAEFEAKAAQYATDVRELLARHETQVDHVAEDVKAAVSSPVGEAIAAAVHVPDTLIIRIVNTVEEELAKLAGTPPAAAEPAADLDRAQVPAPAAAAGPVVGGQAF